jgi:hypothetical protein
MTHRPGSDTRRKGFGDFEATTCPVTVPLRCNGRRASWRAPKRQNELTNEAKRWLDAVGTD